MLLGRVLYARVWAKGFFSGELLHVDVGALLIRIGFEGILHYNYNKEPPNPVLIIKAPTLLNRLDPGVPAATVDLQEQSAFSKARSRRPGFYADGCVARQDGRRDGAATGKMIQYDIGWSSNNHLRRGWAMDASVMRSRPSLSMAAHCNLHRQLCP